MTKVKIKIERGVYLKDLPQEAIKRIKKHLTFPNQAYQNALKQGRFIPASLDPHVKFYMVNKSKVYWIPRGYLYYLLRWFRNKDIPFKIYDRTIKLPELDISFHGDGREYQEIALKDMLKYPVGVLVAPTGSGKTVMACKIIAARKQPTLIVVHSKELMYQWQKAIKNFLHFDCGLVGDSKFDIKPITVGIINTVRMKTEELEPHFGQIICDECHRCTANTWADTVQDFKAYHYLGLTATPFRKDGLGHAIFASLGPKLHVVDKETLHKIGAVLKPDIYRVPTRFRYMFTNDYSKMISELTKDENRNQLIADIIHKDYAQYKEALLIVSDRKKHCEMISETLRINNRILTGSTNKRERKEIVEEVKNGTCKVLISTLQLVGEGFDVPEMSAVFLTTPIKFSGRVIQIIGRVLRPSKGKVPRVYDFRDNDVDVLRYSGFNRDKIYLKQWG